MGWLKKLIKNIVIEVLTHSKITIDKDGNASIAYKNEF